MTLFLPCLLQLNIDLASCISLLAAFGLLTIQFLFISSFSLRKNTKAKSVQILSMDVYDSIQYKDFVLCVRMTGLEEMN
jgi:hypothetical protein